MPVIITLPDRWPGRNAARCRSPARQRPCRADRPAAGRSAAGRCEHIGVVAVGDHINIGLSIREHAADHVAFALMRLGTDQRAGSRASPAVSSVEAPCHRRRPWRPAARRGSRARPTRSLPPGCSMGAGPRCPGLTGRPEVRPRQIRHRRSHGRPLERRIASHPGRGLGLRRRIDLSKVT